MINSNECRKVINGIYGKLFILCPRLVQSGAGRGQSGFYAGRDIMYDTALCAQKGDRQGRNKDISVIALASKSKNKYENKGDHDVTIIKSGKRKMIHDE